MVVTIDGGWIDNWIYWITNTARDYTYESLLHSDQCSQSRCLVTAPTADNILNYE
jgi:hypothetical protein